MLGKLKGPLRERARAGENPYQTPNSWVSLSLSTLRVLSACGGGVRVFSTACAVPPSLPCSDAGLLYGKISQGSPPIFPGSAGTIPVLCPRAGQGTKAGPGSHAGDPAADRLSPLLLLTIHAGDGFHPAKSLPSNISVPTMVVKVSHQYGPLIETLPVVAMMQQAGHLSYCPLSSADAGAPHVVGCFHFPHTFTPHNMGLWWRNCILRSKELTSLTCHREFVA